MNDMSNRISYGTIAVSVFCLTTMAIVLPIINYRLDSAFMDIEQRMENFKVGLKVNWSLNASINFSLNLVEYGRKLSVQKIMDELREKVV